MRRPETLVAALPLLLIPCCWLWWWASGLNPGVEVGRSADLLLFAGCLAAIWAVRGPTLPAAVLPLLFALAWQILALLWAPVHEPGIVWLVERTTACACAIALARWSGTVPATRLVAAVALAGTGILALTCLTQIGDFGALLRVQREAPFGNVNFTVGAALPLVAIGLTRFLHGGAVRWWIWALVSVGCAGALAAGTLGGDPCHAVWLGGLAAIACALALRLPRRWHGPVLLVGGTLLVLAWAASIAGLADASDLGPGTAQRVHIWRGTLASLAGPAGLVGHGPGAIIAVLPEQQSFAAAWLTVPSYAAHAHAEPLQVLSDGGAVLAGLLIWALVHTLRPLWRRREEPASAALLVGWCTAGTLSLVESHLSQPGGLLCLAVLAGISWAVAAEERPVSTPVRLRSVLVLFCAAGLAILIVRELAADGGGPASIEARCVRRLGDAPAANLAVLDGLRARLGPLDELDLRRALCLGLLGRHAEADLALAAQLGRTPGYADALALARRRVATGQAQPDLVLASTRARQRAFALLATVPSNAVNAADRAALAAELARPAAGGPAPAR